MRVGTSSADEKRGFTGEDHPHACGDKAFMQAIKDGARGSSPCVWGQEVLVV